jgi:hypothetical protein
MSVKAIPRTSTFTGATFTTNSSPVQDNEIARANVVNAFTYFFYNAGCFVAEKERKLVADGSFTKM